LANYKQQIDTIRKEQNKIKIIKKNDLSLGYKITMSFSDLFDSEFKQRNKRSFCINCTRGPY
jgi:hypothetical protein